MGVLELRPQMRLPERHVVERGSDNDLDRHRRTVPRSCKVESDEGNMVESDEGDIKP